MLRKNEYSIPRNGLIGEWLLDGNGYDTNDGTKINGTASNVTWYTNGNNGYQKGYGYFNRSNSWIDVSSNINLGSSFTLSIWYTYDQYSAVVNCLFAFDVRGATEDRIMLYASGNSLNSQYCHDGSCSWIGNTTVTHDGKWHNVILTYSSNSFKIYFDGVLKTTNSIVSTAFNCPLSIGCWYNGSIVYPFGGNLSMMRAYNRVISDKEIQNIFLEGKRKLGICGNPEILSNLIGYWDMNGDGNDIIGGKNLTMSGTPTLDVDRFGINNKSYSFNGSNQGFFTAANSFPTLVNNCTVSFRCYLNDISSIQSIIANGDNNANVGWILGILLDGSNQTWNFTKPGIVNENTGITPIVGEWQHVAISISGYVGTLYINGKQVWTGSNSSTISNNTSYTRFGYNDVGGSPTQFFNGKLSEVMFFNIVKTSNEINALYQISKQKYLSPFRKSLPRHLYDGLQLWLGGSYSGNSYYDYSDNKYTATSNNDVFDGRIFDYNYVTLDGASSYLTIPDSTNLRITGPITLNIWHKWDGGTISSYSSLFNKGVSSEFEILFSSIGNVSFYRGGTLICNTGARSNVSGKYNMYTFVDDGTNGYIYINGKLYASGASGLTISATTNDIHICEISSNYLGGDISYPMIWNKALDGVAIQNLYYATFRL